MYCLYTGKRKISVENITFYLLKIVQNINNSSLNSIILYHLVGHNLGIVIIQLMAKCDVSNN